MATDYSLNFKATLDTEDIQQKLDELKQQQSGLDQLNTSIKTGSSTRTDSSFKDIEQYISKIATVIQSLQTSIEKLNSLSKDDTNSIAKSESILNATDSSSNINDTSVLMQLKKQIPKLSDSVASVSTITKGDDHVSDAVKDLSKTIEELQRVIDRTLNQSQKTQQNTSASKVMNPSVVQQTATTPPVAPVTNISKTAVDEQTLIKQQAVDNEIKNFTNAYNKFQQYGDTLKDKREFNSLFKNYKQSYVDMYNSSGEQDFSDKFLKFKTNLDKIIQYTTRFDKGVDMSDIRKLTKTQSSESAMKTRVNFFQNKNPQFVGNITESDLRNIGRNLGVTAPVQQPTQKPVNKGPFRPFGMDEYQRRIAGAGIGFLGSTIAGGMQNVMKAGGDQSGAQTLGDVSNVFMKTASGGLMGGPLGAGIGLAVGLTETALNRLADTINKTVDEVNQATERFTEAKAKDNIIKNITEKQDYVKAVKNEDISYFEKKITEEQTKFNKSSETLALTGKDEQSFQKFQQRLEEQKSRVAELEKGTLVETKLQTTTGTQTMVSRVVDEEKLELAKQELKRLEDKAKDRDSALKEYSASSEKLNQYKETQQKLLEVKKQRTENYRDIVNTEQIETSIKKLDFTELAQGIDSADESIRRLKDQIVELAKSGNTSFEATKRLEQIQKQLKSVEQERTELLRRQSLMENIRTQRDFDRNSKASQEDLRPILERDEKIKDLWKSTTDAITSNVESESVVTKIKTQQSLEESRKNLDTERYFNVKDIQNRDFIEKQIDQSEMSLTEKDIETASSSKTVTEKISELWKTVEQSINSKSTDDAVRTKIDEFNILKKSGVSDEQKTVIDEQIKKAEATFTEKDTQTASSQKSIFEKVSTLWSETEKSIRQAERGSDSQIQTKIDELNSLNSGTYSKERDNISSQLSKVENAVSSNDKETAVSQTVKNEKIANLWKRTEEAVKNDESVESIQTQISDLERLKETSTEEDKLLIDQQIEKAKYSVENKNLIESNQQYKTYSALTDIWKGADDIVTKNTTAIENLTQTIEELNSSKQSMSEEDKRTVDKNISNAENTLNSRDLDSAKKNEDEIESRYDTNKRISELQNQQRTSAFQMLEDIETEDIQKKFKSDLYSISNDETLKTSDKIQRLETVLEDNANTAYLSRRDKVDLLKEASRADITEEQRQTYLDEARKSDIKEKSSIANVIEARTEIITQLNERIANLKAPDMSNVNSLASQGYMISEADDNARLDEQNNYLREQTNLQRQLRDHVTKLNTTDTTFQ